MDGIHQLSGEASSSPHEGAERNVSIPAHLQRPHQIRHSSTVFIQPHADMTSMYASVDYLLAEHASFNEFQNQGTPSGNNSDNNPPLPGNGSHLFEFSPSIESQLQVNSSQQHDLNSFIGGMLQQTAYYHSGSMDYQAKKDEDSTPAATIQAANNTTSTNGNSHLEDATQYYVSEEQFTETLNGFQQSSTHIQTVDKEVKPSGLQQQLNSTESSMSHSPLSPATTRTSNETLNSFLQANPDSAFVADEGDPTNWTWSGFHNHQMKVMEARANQLQSETELEAEAMKLKKQQEAKDPGLVDNDGHWEDDEEADDEEDDDDEDKPKFISKIPLVAVKSTQLSPPPAPASAPAAKKSKHLPNRKSRKEQGDLDHVDYTILDVHPTGKPSFHFAGLSEFRLPNDLTIEDFEHLNTPDSPFIYTRNSKAHENSYEPAVNRKVNPNSSYYRNARNGGSSSRGYDRKAIKGAGEGNFALCPFCPLTTENSANHCEKMFFKRNDSNYLHHLIQFHGVFSNGAHVPTPDASYWATTPKDNTPVEVIQCVECDELIALKKFKPATPNEHRLLKYLRHVKEFHKTGKNLAEQNQKNA